MAYLQRLEEHRKLEDDLSQGKAIVLNTHAVLKNTEDRKVAIKDFSAAILRQDPRCFVKDTPVLFLDGNCYIYAYYNRQRCYVDLGLHLVSGSLGFGKKTPRWFEFGSETYCTAKDFMSALGSWDWHVWLEDGDGNVWDVVPDIWHPLAKTYGRHFSFGSDKETVVMEGLSKAEAKKHGLEYVPADESTQHILFSVAQKLYEPYFKALQLE